MTQRQDPGVLQRKTIESKLLDSKKVSMKFTKESLSQVLKRLSKETGLAFATHLQEDNPRISLSLSKTPLRIALDRIASLAKTRWEVQDGVICFGKRLRHSAKPREIPLAVWEDRVKEILSKNREELESKKVSIVLQNVPLDMVLEMLSEWLEIEVVPEQAGNPPVNLIAEKATLRDAAELALWLADSSWYVGKKFPVAHGLPRARMMREWDSAEDFHEERRKDLIKEDQKEARRHR